jgi:hypothetical protein
MTRDGNPTSQECAEIDHCVSKIRQLVDEGRDDRRSILQLGYNLGRLSELTGEGRGPFWDAWKDAVASWDRPGLAALALELLNYSDGPRRDSGETSDEPESTPR